MQYVSVYNHRHIYKKDAQKHQQAKGELGFFDAFTHSHLLSLSRGSKHDAGCPATMSLNSAISLLLSCLAYRDFPVLWVQPPYHHCFIHFFLNTCCKLLWFRFLRVIIIKIWRHEWVFYEKQMSATLANPVWLQSNQLILTCGGKYRIIVIEESGIYYLWSKVCI